MLENNTLNKTTQKSLKIFLINQLTNFLLNKKNTHVFGV